MEFHAQGIIFDLDGTLIEYHRTYFFERTQEILEILGHPPVSNSVMQRHFESFDFFGFLEVEGHDEFLKSFWPLYDSGIPPPPLPISGVSTLLEDLAGRGARLGIATARPSPGEAVRLELSGTGIAEYISHFGTRHGRNVDWKEKSETIADVCASLSLEAKDCALVGDTPSDILSARAAGIGCAIAVLSGGIDRETLSASGPDFLLPDVTGVRAVIQPPMGWSR